VAGDFELRAVLRSQYHAALSMLEQTIDQCPDSLWNDPADSPRFWRLVFHTLFYTHLYLEDREENFRRWEKQGPGIEGDETEMRSSELTAFTKPEIKEYLGICRTRVDESLASVDFEGESGFHWLPFQKLELQFYNIRHIQQHAGQLSERLRLRAGIDPGWTGRTRFDTPLAST